MIICLKPEEEDMVVSANIRLNVSALEPLLSKILNIKHCNRIFHRILNIIHRNLTSDNKKFLHRWAGRMGREYTGPCADCYAGFSQCSLFRYFLDVLLCTCMNLYVLKCTWNLYIVKCVLPSDIGSNIGSYSLAVAGMHPTREVKLYVLHIYITYTSIQFLLIGGKVIHCLKL